MFTSWLRLGGVRTTTPVVPRLVPVGVESWLRDVIKPVVPETGTGGGDGRSKIRWCPKLAAVVT